MTINPGLRYERFVMSIPAQSAGAGTWVPARDFAEQENIVNWNTLLAAVRLSVGPVRRRPHCGEGRAQPLRSAGRRHHHPAAQPEEHRVPDVPVGVTRNNDLRAQNDEIAMRACTGSLQPSLGIVDPDLKRPHQWEYTVMVQRQIGGRTSVMVGYYGRRFWDLYTTVNDAVPSTAYTPVTITNPLTNEPMTVYNQDPTTRGAVRNVLKTIPELRQTYNGVEFQINTRLTKATLFAGLTIGSNYRRSGQRRPEQSEPAHQQSGQHRIRFAVSDSRRLQLHATRGLPALGIDSRAVRAAATRTYPRDHHASAGPDASHAERPGRRTRRVPLSVGQPHRSADREIVPRPAGRASSRRSMCSTSSTTTRSPMRCKRLVHHSAGRHRS